MFVRFSPLSAAIAATSRSERVNLVIKTAPPRLVVSNFRGAVHTSLAFFNLIHPSFEYKYYRMKYIVNRISFKKGISAHQLHRTLGVTYKTAWFMAHRIRLAMNQEPVAGLLEGRSEADET